MRYLSHPLCLLPPEKINIIAMYFHFPHFSASASQLIKIRIIRGAIAVSDERYSACSEQNSARTENNLACGSLCQDHVLTNTT